MYSAVNWHTNALVDATAISGPAIVGSTSPDCLAIDEYNTLVSAIFVNPFFLTISRALSVSAVSPLWLIKINRVWLSSSIGSL